MFRPVRQGIYTEGRLHPFSTPLDLLGFHALPLGERLRLGMLTQRLLGQRDDLDSLSTEAWIRRYVGDRAYESLFRPLVLAKFGCEGSEIAAAFVRGRLLARGRSRGALRWFERLGYLDGGSALVAEELRKRLLGLEVPVLTSAEVERVERRAGDFLVTIRGSGGPRQIAARFVVSSLPTPILDRAASGFPEEFGLLLRQVDYRAVVVATVGLARSLSSNYWISVIDRALPFNALIEHTRLHDRGHYQGAHVLYIGAYLGTDHPLWSASDEDVMTCFRAGLARGFPHFRGDDVLWWRVARDRYASPIFKVGYGATMSRLAGLVPGLHHAGTLRVYPDSRNVSSALRIGREVAETILEEASAR